MVAQAAGETAAVILVWIAIVAFFGWATGKVMESKGRDKAGGILLGIFLGIFGLIIAWITPPKDQGFSGAGVGPAGGPQARRECPHCKESMRRDANICPHCRLESEPWKFHEGYWWAQGGNGDMHYFDERSREWKKPLTSLDL